MTFATHPERQFMEYLRGTGWVKGAALPPSKLVVSLLKKGWIEQQLQGQKNEIFYRMTAVGLKALKAPVRVGRPRRRGNDDEDSADPCRAHWLFGICRRSNLGAQGWWQAAAAGKAVDANGLQARGNGQGHEAVGW